MRVVVDEDVCVGSGNCEATCPEVFEVVDGKSKVKADPVPSEQEGRAREAVDGCPIGAISIS